MAVVKADGYGHGAVMVAREALGAGATSLGVATVDEGVALRSNGIAGTILVLGPIEPSEIDTAIIADLELAVADMEFLGTLRRRVAALGQQLHVHVKVDTGMRRFGSVVRDAIGLCREIEGESGLRLAGVFTHFADADGLDDSFTASQAARFEEVVEQLRAERIGPGLVHASNSAAALRWRQYDYDMVRIGIAMYGLQPAPGMQLPVGIRPAMEIRSRLARVSDLEPGETVSYGRTYEAREPERIGLVPIGYADGYRRELSNRGQMGLAGIAAPVRGRVCMDQTIVGIPNGVEAAAGDEVVAVGRGGDGAPTVADLAADLGTIGYEVVTGIARRVPRIYIKNGRVVAIQDLHAVRELDL